MRTDNFKVKRIKLIAFCFLLMTVCTMKVKSADSVSVHSPSIIIDSTRIRTHSLMLGFGYHNGLDTYLSPLEYTGMELRLLRENRRQTKLMKGRIWVQNLLQTNFAYTKSPTDDGKELSGLVDWNLTWHYQWKVLPHLRLLAGGGPGIHGGFVYNTRNGNNPAQARLNIDLNASGMALYDFNVKNNVWTLRYQADLPFLGMMFSPNYTQSYYEIFSLGNYDHNICVTNPFQALTFNQLLTLDIPLWSGTLRVGYQGIIRQAKVNNLKQHDWSHLFILGYVKEFYLMKKLKTNKKPK